ncbi:hypothetical protein GCM10011383_24150 [Hymenobacter cavernae]|uniref:Cytochrome c domain-containing protein n=1 Tax=Hymenobacter cavernae TaxID=2044852 RepID=A0ABQ1U7J5_9BACT|nr:hypothetical protein GCM10011383_24150 [Hymenobacter cavernae]
MFAGTGLLNKQEEGVCGNPNEVALDTTLIETSDSTANAYQVASNTLSQEDMAVVEAGDALFKNNCAQCHAVFDVVVGPALNDITKRRSISWLIPWVKNSSKVVASGDEYAVKLFNQYQEQQMPSFQLSDKEIKSIIKYIEVESPKSIVNSTAAIVD